MQLRVKGLPEGCYVDEDGIYSERVALYNMIQYNTIISYNML